MNESAATVLGTGRRQMQGQGDDKHTIDSDDEVGLSTPLLSSLDHPSPPSLIFPLSYLLFDCCERICFLW